MDKIEKLTQHELNRTITRNDMRIAEPEAWHETLKTLETDIIQHSATQVDVIVPETPESYEAIIRNNIEILQKATENFGRLEIGHYCHGSFNMLVVDQSRKDVASLYPVLKTTIDEILSTLKTFEAKRDSYIHVQDIFWKFTDFLKQMKLKLPFFDTPRAITTETDEVTDDERNILIHAVCHATSIAARMIDYGIVSYSGAHLERFDLRDIDESAVPESQPVVWSYPCDTVDGMEIRLTRRSLMCLDAFLHGEMPWVFEVIHRGAEQSSRGLYLTSTIEDFTDVWGPVWKTLKKTGGKVLSFSVGLGFIVPWDKEADTPDLVPGEILCHWTHQEKDLAGREAFPNSINGAAQHLLIGAKVSYTKFKEDMENRGRCIPLGTSYPSTYVDSHTVQLQASMYVGLSWQTMFKKRSGTSLRQDTYQTWVNASMDRRADALKGYYAVEISRSTEHLQRITLAQALCSKAMRNHLSKDRWEPKLKRARRLYFKLLKKGDVEKFMRRLRVGKYKQSFAQALEESFKVLKNTGPVEDGHFHAFWEEKNGQPLAIRYPNKTYTWSGLLSDSPLTCAFAIVTPRCIEFVRRTLDRSCGRKYHLHDNTHSKLRTSIKLNPLGSGALTSGTLNIRDHGSLRIIGSLEKSGGYIAVYKDDGVFRRIFRALGQDKSHVENGRYSHDDKRMINVLVKSDRELLEQPVQSQGVSDLVISHEHEIYRDENGIAKGLKRTKRRRRRRV